MIPPTVGLNVDGVTSTYVAISWQPPEGMKFIRKYQVSYTTSGGNEQLHEVQDTTSTELTSLKPDTEYITRVRAKVVNFGGCQDMATYVLVTPSTFSPTVGGITRKEVK